MTRSPAFLLEVVRPHYEWIAMGLIFGKADWQRPTALSIGLYQPFHDGHRALITEGLKCVGQVCVAVRDTHGVDEKNPYQFECVKARIEHALREFEGRVVVVQLPNITNVFYGRDVGYAVERIDLDASVQSISATDLRRRLVAQNWKIRPASPMLKDGTLKQAGVVS